MASERPEDVALGVDFKYGGHRRARPRAGPCGPRTRTRTRRPLAARVQLAAAHVLGEEGVQLGQQAHGSELVEVVP
jgi:hypothetical protein